MMKFPKLFSFLLLFVSAVAMFSVSADAEARRMGGGGSFGRQSAANINRAPATPPAANMAPPNAAAVAAPKTGASRFLGPIAGIAAGLGIAALLSSFGLSGALLEFLSSAVLIGIVIFGIMFLLRRLRGGANQPAMQGATNSTNLNNTLRQSNSSDSMSSPAMGGFSQTPPSAVAQPIDSSWFVPADFDTASFLQEAKKQFVTIQGIWDSGDVSQLRDYLTDDLVRELTPQITQNAGQTKTEIVLLNAELLGIEKVEDGHLASVRFSGMLREQENTAAFRYEEVWNLYKTYNSGWLLAGIQQIPVEN